MIELNEYVGREFDDGLKHFKYISKKPNPNKPGKFIYTYEDSKNTLSNLQKDATRKRRVLNQSARQYQKRIKKMDLKASEKRYGKDSKEYQNAKRWHDNMSGGYIQNYKSGSAVGFGKKYESAYLRGESSRSNYAVTQRQKSLAGHVDSFMQKHGNTVANIMNAPGNIVDAGVSTVKSYASTTVSSIKSTGSKAISSGKSFINSLFGKKEKPNKTNTRYDDYPY